MDFLKMTIPISKDGLTVAKDSDGNDMVSEIVINAAQRDFYENRKYADVPDVLKPTFEEFKNEQI